MFRQFVYKLSQPNKNKVYSVIRDIDYFFAYIKQNGEINDWQFRQIFPAKYWNYINYFSWLTAVEQNYLITGCLSITLFIAHSYLENNGNLIPENYSDIEKALNSFTPKTSTHERLYYMVKEALIFTWKKMNNIETKEHKNNIYQSIGWTLNNIILTQPPLNKKIKNQR